MRNSGAHSSEGEGVSTGGACPVVMGTEGKECPSPLLVAGAGSLAIRGRGTLAQCQEGDAKREKDQNAEIGKRMPLSLQGHTGCV